VARRTLLVARGSERGAEWPLGAGSTCVIGAEAALCDVVLGDDGVARRHCSLSLDARAHVIVTALDAPVWVGRRELPRGASMAMPDFLPLRCGQATMLVGPEGSDWSYSLGAAESAPGLGERADVVVQQVRAASPLAFAALLLGSTALVAGSVWGAVSWLTTPQNTVDSAARTQRWLLSAAPRDSELQLVVDDTLQRLVVTGYVRTERERALLAAALARQPYAPRAEFVAVEPMLATVRSLAQQHGLACEPAYSGAGRVACDPVTDAAAAERVRVASQQVAGLRELALPVASPPVASVKPAARRAAASGSRRFAVLMSNKRGNQLIGPAGERWSEGDDFDGMTIRRIQLDHVVFERDRDEVVLQLAQLK
jgi:hypothetical protein